MIVFLINQNKKHERYRKSVDGVYNYRHSIIFASSLLRDAALHEFQAYEKTNFTISLLEFCEFMKKRYKRKDQEMVMRDKLFCLKQ